MEGKERKGREVGNDADCICVLTTLHASGREYCCVVGLLCDDKLKEALSAEGI